MENETQTQQQLERLEEQILQQGQYEEQDGQSEDMKTVSKVNLSDAGGVSKEDSSTYMCVQEEECEQESFASDEETLQQLEYRQQDEQQLQIAHQRNHNHAHRQYSPKKSVSFKTLVDIFQLSDAWQLHVKKSSLKTEEDQAKRRILQRNY